MTEDDECDMFAELTESLCTKSTEHANDVFSSSLDDADLPASASTSTYDVLKQTIYECCDMADATGMQASFHDLLKDFAKKCKKKQKRPVTDLDVDVEERPAKKQATATGVVAMTNTKHSGPGRVHNTYSMAK